MQLLLCGEGSNLYKGRHGREILGIPELFFEKDVSSNVLVPLIQVH